MKAMRFGIPIVWREPKDHVNDCYFCSVDMAGFNRHQKKSWKHPDLESARRPIPHGEEIPVLKYSELSNLIENKENDGEESSSRSSAFEDTERNLPKLLSQKNLNDMTRFWSFKRKL